ncbi:MAG: polysaccharide biosynthesis protein [Eubacterium sp.]|nr:polysaccharide biosynthesis protein [Eubacterium sp.]
MRGEIDKIPDSIVEKAKKNRSSRDESLNKMAFTSGFFYILAQFCVRGLTFVVTPFYSRMLSKAQYGDIRVYESWLLIAYTVMSLCLWRSEDVAKYDFRDKFNEYTSSVHTLSYLAIAGFFGLALIFKEPFQRFTSMDDLMFYMCFLYVFTYTSMLYLQRRDKQMLRYKFSTLATLLTIVPGTALSLWLIYRGRQLGLLDTLVHRRIIGYYVPQIIGGAIIAVVIWVQGKKFFDLTYWKYGLKYSLPLIPEALSIQIMNQSDKIMIQKLIGSDPTGVFSLATTISFIIWILEDSVWNAWIPWLYEKISRDETEDIAKPWTTVMHIFGLISWALVVLAPEEILILGGKKYYAAIYLIAPMVSGTLFRFFSYSYSAVENYYKKTKYVAAGTIGTMFLNVILNYICIIKFGYMAAAYTTAASYVVLLIVQGILERKVTGQVIVPLYKTVLIALMYGAINVATISLYALPWFVRWGILAAVMIGAFIVLRNQFLAVYKMIRKK